MHIFKEQGKLFFFSLAIILAISCSPIYKVVDSNYQNWTIDQKTDSIRDENYLKILNPYSEKLNSELTEIIAFADTSLIAYRPESPLGNFICDLLLNYAQEFIKEKHPNISVSFCLANNGGLRTSLPAGEIRVNNIFELLPFENELVLLKLTGEQVRSLADFIVSRDGEGVAGISFGMRYGKAINLSIHNEPLEQDSSYWMITNDYLANGGDGMKILREAGCRIETGDKIRDIVICKLKQMNANGYHINAKTDGRIYHVE